MALETLPLSTAKDFASVAAAVGMADEATHEVRDGTHQRLSAKLSNARVMNTQQGTANNSKSKSLASESFYSYNGHGDTTNLTQQSGTTLAVTATYEYDAFGNCSATGTAGNDNPFRYNGQYYDEETGLIYLRNRYYDPATGRFIQQDPAKDGLNWYIYCNNDPVNYTDPWGLQLVLVGTGDEVQTIWNTIKEITQDDLVLTQEVDARGRLMDSYVVTVAEERYGGCDNGSILVRRIAYSDEVVEVAIWSGVRNEYDPYTKTVYFNPNLNPEVWTIDENTGAVYPATRPSFVGLAHELIHADRDIRGVYIDYSQKTNYSYNYWHDGWFYSSIRNRTSYTFDEELATIGIMYNDWYWDITENDIRAEHGLPLRGAY